MFGTFIVVICFGLLVAALTIGRNVCKLKSRKELDDGTFSRATEMLNNHFQHNLLDMQVDAVFNSLTALIETERMRLKTLVAPTVQSMPVAAPQACRTDVSAQVNDEPQPQAPEEQLHDEPAPRAPEAHPADPLHGSEAQRVQACAGLSRAERELVEKMREFRGQSHRKLEAVV
jgi:uncharacterized membrane protein